MTPLARLVCLSLLALSTAASGAERMLFVATMDWTRLYPYHHRETGMVHTGADGQEVVTLSNSCGSQETQFHVERALVGDPGPSVLAWNTTSEWCQSYPQITTVRQLVSVMKENGAWQLEWSERLFQLKDGREFIVSDDTPGVGWLALDSLRKPIPKDETVFYRSKESIDPSRRNHLLRLGIIFEDDDGDFSYATGYFVSDLVKVMRSQRPSEPAR